MSPSANDPQDGSYEKPFIDLMNAMERADELTAPWTGPVVYIYLLKGTHYILEGG